MPATDFPASPPKSKILPWLQLFRLSAAPSALSNILVGFLLVNSEWSPIGPLLLLIASSFFLYSAGMLSNDIADVRQDRAQRRPRPLAQDWIGLPQARLVCLILFALGILLPAAVCSRSLIIALLLGISILLYNGPLKRTWSGPIFMGACRSLNIMLGASYLPSGTSVLVNSGVPSTVEWIAISLGILIAGLTYFAKNEAGTSSRWQLTLGTLIILFGLTGFATAGWVDTDNSNNASLFAGLILLISAPVIIRLIWAIRSCQSQPIQFAVISLLKTLIIYDAAFCLLVGQPDFFYALIVLSLWIPSFVLGKWVKST